MRFVIILVLSVSLMACKNGQQATVNVFDSNAGCMEGPMAEFGQYIGKWIIEDSQFAKDGSGWADGAGAQWDFACLGNGTAIQDFWKPAGGSVGTNLRTYNPDTQSWDIAWAIKGTPGFAHINAKRQSNGEIVMTYVSPEQNPPRRITFFPATKNNWNWKLELSFDQGENWTEVYRIRATRSSSPKKKY